jgi:Transglutaminase-like superfamily
MRILRRYFRLSSFERRIFAEACVGLVATWTGMRVAGFGAWKRVASWVTPARGASGCAEEGISVCAAVVRMQDAAERRLFFRTSCLEHALVLWWLLRRNGIVADIRIGGRKDEGRFAAHAWVEVEGRPVGDVSGEHRHFAPFEGPASVMESEVR